MAKFYLGVRIPNRAYESILLENVDMNKEVCYLRDEIAKKIQYPKDEIELIYCGTVLDDDEKISEVNLEPNTTVHVFKRCPKPKPYISSATYSDEDCRKIAEMFGTVTGTQMNVQSRTNILQKILDKFPEFRKNLGAQALIRDSVLFNSLEKPEVIKKVAQNYSIICDAAEFIVKTTRKEITRNYYDTCSDESFSEFTSGSEEEAGQSQTEQSIRRISRDQLAQALIMAGTASLNSLSNIAQRNSTLAEEEQGLDDEQTPTSSSNASLRITPSIFNSALNRALLVSTTPSAVSLNTSSADQSQSMDTSETQEAVNVPEVNSENITRYARELQLMREVGLSDDNVNLQALILSNGEVEAAINFVFGGMHLLN